MKAAIASMSKSSIEINEKSRNADSQERPVSLSALMTCLYNPHGDNDFAYRYRNADTMAGGIPSSVKRVLPREGMPEEKTKIIAGGLAFLGTGINLRKPNALKGMLPELEENAIPFSNKGTNYDIIGRFHEEFLRFAGVTNVKRGIVLTPRHIAELFTDSVPIGYEIAYWIVAVEQGLFLYQERMKSSLSLRGKLSNHNSDKVKRNRLVGFESNAMMYAPSISNMPFRGDGESNISHEDFFRKRR